MGEPFYTSTEASLITGCSRRQLQYWRKQGVVVPTVNPGGKGRNVYYTESDLLILSVMKYLLSLGLNFDVSLKVLETLREKEILCFLDWSLSKNTKKRFMLVLDTEEKNTIHITNFDTELAVQKLQEGFAIAPFGRDRIYQKLQDNLQAFYRNRKSLKGDRRTKN
ncbi:MerR family transcriptional regulator [Myxosarcina sp. GI1]|uniref:MerR family transcriptional regulator n=1 Tax=Myxosarcina sp. GI1 TaxID=1541065 RepID=UPI00068A7AD4|nr:MerR family transcriptional regulator [Myxosarcina sp. GI1]